MDKRLSELPSTKRDFFSNLQCKFLLKQFGSSVFGGADRTSDLDLVLISYCDLLPRDKFNCQLVSYLKQHGAKNVFSIPTAKIPIVKFEFCNVEFDLIYCSMITPTPQEAMNIKNDEYLLNYKNTSYDKANLYSFMGWKTC